jgi:hypothetical protein
MELLALLSNRDEAIIPNVKSALEKYTLYPLKIYIIISPLILLLLILSLAGSLPWKVFWVNSMMA